jgi:hypothetical protein
LAVSGRTRGAVWNLSTGERMYLTRAFRGAYFDQGRMLYADFPKVEGQERTMAMLDLTRPNIEPGIVPTEDSAALQLGPYLLLRKRASDKGSLHSKVTLEMQDVRDAKPVWSRNFPNEAPDVRANPAANVLVFIWDVKAATAKDEIQNDASLSSRFAAQPDHEGVYLLEVVEESTGKVLGKMLLDTGKRSFRIVNVTAAGDWVFVTDNDNRTLAYSLSTGERKATLFGNHSVVSPAARALAIGNEAGEVDVYSLPTVEKCAHISFSSPVSAASFSADSQRLFVLTANQTAYKLDTAQLLRPSVQHAKTQ